MGPAHPHNLRIATALAEVDRSLFIKTDREGLLAGHSIPPKNSLRRMLEISHFQPDAKALHIGAGSGYVSAVLARLCRQVIAMELSSSLAQATAQRLPELGYNNVQVRNANGENGAVDEAPFDLIVVSTPGIQDKISLLRQLSTSGQLVCLEETSGPLQSLVRYIHRGKGHIHRSEHGLIDFSPDKDDLLIDLGLVKPETLAEARKRAHTHHSLLIDEVRRLQHLDEKKLYRYLTKQYGIEFGSLDTLVGKIDYDLFERFSKAFLDHNHVLPLYIEDGTLHITSSDPDFPTEEIQTMFPQLEIKRVLVTPTDFQRLWSMLNRYEGEYGSADSHMDWHSPGYDEDLLDNNRKVDEKRPIAIYEALILDAVADRASDIHLEKYGEKIRVRLRVDGSLRDLDHYHISSKDLPGLINVIKLRGDMDISERRLPQGGRARVRVGNQYFDLRIQVQPSLYGEHVVIRLLPQNSQLISIDALGMPEQIADQYKRLLRNPAGLVLVVGPTGSGKSTTLNAGLQQLALDTSRKVITVEDPIEYSINNIQQTRVRPGIGFGFAEAMRSFVRQDPDVIMVGEIRDHETALEALRASQTGHIVLSTLHCNDAVDAVQRLFDLNVHPNSLASELLAVIAQRLAKKICPQCKTRAEPDPQILTELFPVSVPDNFVCYEGKGCEHCNHTGTKGRIGVIEYLHLNPDLRVSISKGTAIGELRAEALDSGLFTMRDSALDHVIEGVIPLSELPRILPAERMAPEKRGAWKARS